MSIKLKDTIYDLVNLSNNSTTTGHPTVKLYVQNNDEVNFGGTSGSTTIYLGYRSVDSRPIPTSYVFGGPNISATIKANGFIKHNSSDSYVLLGGGGHKAVSDFATSGHTHTKSQITDFPTSMPASDVYSWAKASTKPSYNFGEIGTGVATIGDGTNQIYLRTNGSWASTIYHQSNADEAVVFLNAGKNVSSTNNYTTSWIFAYGTPANRPDWTTLTPAMQIKGNSVVINKLIGSKVGAEYNLDVNGSFNATSGYINKNAILHAGNTKITNGTITINGTNITPLTFLPSHDHTIYTLTSTRHDSDAPAPNSKNGLTFQFSYNIDSNWSNVLMMKSYSDNNYTCSQIITPAGNPGKDTGYSGDMKWRQGRNSTWLGWKTILDSNNYTAYTVTKTGTGASGTWGISISGNAATATSATNAGYATSAGSASSATTAASADVATIARSLGTDNSMKAYAQLSNEFNFGGTNNSSAIYFGYRAVDSKPIPTAFVFGSSNGTATLTANGYKKKDSSDSYVLLGGGGHKAVSDFATSGHTHSQYLTSLPSHTHDYLPTEQVSVEQNTDAYTWIRGYALTDGKLRSHVYNTNGNEWSYWIGMSTSKTYGSIIRCSYNAGTPTIQVMGLFNGGWSNWRTCSFEGHTHDYAASSHTHSYLPLSGGTVTDNVRIRKDASNSSTITPTSCILNLGTGTAGHTGYHTGIGFNALSYGNYINHIHAWIGMGPYTTTATAECYPLVFATNESTTTNTAPTVRMTISPSGVVNVVKSLTVGGTAVSLSGHTHNYAASSHTHSYAGSSSAGGAATSANKLNTNAGSATKPVYFTNGVPTACTYGFNGAYGMPVVLAAGYIYKNSYTSTTWAFSGSYCPALTGGITTSVSGGVLAVTWTAASGRSRYIYGAVANMRTSGAVTSYSGTEYKDRSLGMYWLGTATSTTTTYIRAMSQGDQNNDTGMSYDEMWGTSSQQSDHCILSFSIIVIGYWT